MPKLIKPFLIGICILILLFLPLLSQHYLIEGFNGPRIFFLGLFISLILLFSSSKASYFLPDKLLSGIFISFIAVKLFPIFFTLNPGEGLAECVLLLLFGIVFLLFYHLRIKQSHKETKVGVIVITISCLLYAACELSQEYAGNFKSLYQVQVFFIHKNFASSFLFLLSGICFYYFQYRGRHNYFFLLLGFLIILLLLLLQTRAVYLAILISLICWILLKTRNKIWLISILLISFIVLSTLIANYQIFANNMSFLSWHSLEERFKIWHKTIQLIRDNPLFGIGEGNWQFNFMKYGVNDVYMLHQSKINFVHPHNEWLETFSESGLIGGLILVACLFRYTQKLQINSLANKDKIVLSYLAGYLIISSLSFPSSRILHLMMLAFLMANVYPEKEKWKIGSNLPKFAGSVLLIGISMFSFYRLTGEYFTYKTLKAKNKYNLQQVIYHSRKAHSYLYTTDQSGTPLSNYTAWAYYERNQIDSALYYAEQAYNRSPYNFEFITNYGLMLVRNNRIKDGQKQLKYSYSLNQFHDATKLNLAISYIRQGNYSQAYEWINKIPSYELKYPKILELIVEELQFE
jgi:O-antigen ligase